MNKNKKLTFNYNESKIDSLIVALSLMSTTVSVTISLAFGMENNANIIVLAFIFGSFMIKVLYTKRLWIDIDYGSIGILFLILCLFVVSKIFKGDQANYSFTQLLFFAIIPKLSMDLKFETEKVLRYSIYLSLCTVLAVNKFFEYQYADMNQGNMGNIYPIVTMLIICIFHLRYYYKEATKFTKICYCYNAYMLIRTIIVANRGALIAIIICAVVVFLYSFNEDGIIKKNSFKQLIFFIIATILIILIYIYQLEIVQFCSKIFESVFGIVPSFFIKMERYILFNDISNGRDQIYEILIGAIKESPIYGNGIRTFSSYTKGLYPFPHNFILQFFYEGGLLFAIVPVFFAVKIVFDILFGKIALKDNYVMAAMLACQCYPKLLFSTDVWLGTAIWMLITYSYILTRNKNRCKNE